MPLLVRNDNVTSWHQMYAISGYIKLSKISKGDVIKPTIHHWCHQTCSTSFIISDLQYIIYDITLTIHYWWHHTLNKRHDIGSITYLLSTSRIHYDWHDDILRKEMFLKSKLLQSCLSEPQHPICLSQMNCDVTVVKTFHFWLAKLFELLFMKITSTSFFSWKTVWHRPPVG